MRLSTYGPIWLALLLALPVLALNAARYYPFVADDALISLRYASRLLDGHGLTWASGPRVEGYSNLLWTLTLAGVGAFGVELVWASRALGVLCMAVTAAALVWTPRSRGVTPTWVLLTLAATGPCAVWTIGGLEQPMVAALLAIALRATFEALGPHTTRSAEPDRHQERALRIASIALALLCLTRPDSPLFVGMIALGAATVGGRAGGGVDDGVRGAWRRFHRIVRWPAFAFFGQLGFRRLYYGTWVPNTALVKLAWTPERMSAGLSYVREGLADLSPFTELSAATLLLGLCLKQARRPSTIVLLNIIAWLTYVVFAGGDLFPARRHFVPVIVLATFALLEVGSVLEQRYGLRAQASLSALMLVIVMALWQGQPARASMAGAIKERWEWQGQALGLALRDNFKHLNPLIAVTAAGCIAYWSELDAIDMLGLNDHYLPRHRPRDFGRGKSGHELGDARYVLSRKPDLVIFHVGSGPMFRIGRDLDRSREFKRDYQAVRVVLDAPRHHKGLVFVRRNSEKVGITTQPNRDIHVPGYLVNGADSVRVDTHGKLVAWMTPNHRAWVALERPIGHAAIRVDSTPPRAITASVAPGNPRRIELRTTHNTGVALRRLRITPLSR